MRIFIGTTEIAGQIPLFAKGFRELGHDVTTGVCEGHIYKYDPSIRYDLELRDGDSDQVEKIIAGHDVFVFQFSKSLLPDNDDFRMIRRAGKKIISLFNGDDVRYWPAYENEFGFRYTDFSGEERPEYQLPASLAYVLPRLRRAEMYADLIVSGTPTMSMALRPYQHFFVPVNMERLHYNVPGREIPVVVHAPSDKGIKGTQYILAALEELRAEGVRFELRLLHGVANAEVIAALVDADVAVDQILGAGLFSHEAMACGCAVATGYFPDKMPVTRATPLHRITVNSMRDDLRVLLTDKGLRERLAHEGHEHIRKYHTPAVLCRRILDRLAAGPQGVCDYYPTYYALHAILPEYIHIPMEYLKMGTAIAERWGLPHDADPADMACRGLFSSQALRKSLPRWSAVREINTLPGDGTVPSGPLSRFSPQPIPPLLAGIEKFGLMRLCLMDALPLNAGHTICRNLETGRIDYALVLLNTAIKASNPVSIALAHAMGLLLWGKGEYDASLSILSSQHHTESLSCAIAHWLIGMGQMENGCVKNAMPHILTSLTALPHPTYGEIILAESAADIPDDKTAFVICWERPAQCRSWVSPAAIMPDWCAINLGTPSWLVVAFICMAQGYDVRVVNENGKLGTILHHIAILRTVEKNSSVVPL